MFKTVGDLKQYIENLPDDIPLVVYKSNMERSGYMQQMHVNLMSMKRTTETAVDAFDRTEYSYECFIRHPEGEPTLVITQEVTNAST